MFGTLTNEKRKLYSAHGYVWDIRIYQVKEDESYKIFITSSDGLKGEALSTVIDKAIQDPKAIIQIVFEIAQKDIDENEDNKYGLKIIKLG